MLILSVFLGCSDSAPRPEGFDEVELGQLAQMRLTHEPRPSPTNRFADDPAAARLGQVLFFDPGLSQANTISCATCHQPQRYFVDDLTLAEGAGVARRHTPGLLGTEHYQWWFWDGRADSVWSQAMGPIESPVEMAGDRMAVARHVVTRYPDDYQKIFGDLPDFSDPARFPAHARPDQADPEGLLHSSWTGMAAEDRLVVDRTFANAAKAIEAYERLLDPQEAPFDRYLDALLAGDAKGGGYLNESQVRGLEFFLRDGQCVACHNGPLLTDRSFHNLGLPEPTGNVDLGRTLGAMAVQASPTNCAGPFSDTADCPELRHLNPSFDDFKAAFKTPSLRNVAKTAPYMHHGAFPTIASVLEFYSTLPGKPMDGHRELTLQPLGLTPEEARDIEAFLDSLTGPLPEPSLLQ